MKKFNKLKGFKNLKFYSQDEKQILEAVSIFKKLGYRVVDGFFNINEAKEHGGVCVLDDGEITSGWLADDDFEQVTLEDLKGMVGAIKNNQLVFWLNKETLEERYLDKFSVFLYRSSWVEVPEGATFATGDKDSFTFRKDGWYYDNQKGWWIKGDVNLQDLCKHEFVKLFWVKSDIKDNVFTLERLLGCEVLFENSYGSSKGYITSVGDGCSVTLNEGVIITLPNMSRLTFFTEDGDELTFDEYVSMYYGDRCV